MENSSVFFAVMGVLASADIVPFVLAVIIGVPSALLYCLELWVIITNFAHFRSSFFVLVIVRGIFSLTNYVFSYAPRFGKLGLFLSLFLRLPRVGLAFLSFVGYYAFHVENLLTALLLLSRFTSILLPLHYEKFWRRWLPIFLGIALILPLVITAPIFTLDMYIHIQYDNVTFTLDDHKTANELNSSELAAWSALLFTIICLLLNLASLFAYKLCQGQNVGLQKNDGNAKFERKITIYTVCTFVGQLIMVIHTLLIYLTATSLVDEQNNRYAYAQKWLNINLEMNDLLFLAIFNQFSWVSDLTTVAIPAWLLLWASTKLREIIQLKWRRQFEKKTLLNIQQQPIRTTSVKKVHPLTNVG